ncbi:MAG: carboxypeptidase-like regulatory domain-containing protein [Acidobacteriota bacterium]|nr:carboxypeptidase-like regulatory domain-containing protein [Acidobacteriota bacterium]
MRIIPSSLALVALAAAFAMPHAAALPEDPALSAQMRGVLLGVDGTPASGYQIGLKSSAGDLFLAPPTGADGSFAITGLPTGSYTIVAFSPDGAEFPVMGPKVDLQPGQVERMEVRLKPEAHAPGRDPGAKSPASPGRGGSWLSRVWHGSGGGKAGLIAVATLGSYGLYELLDDDDKRMSPITP